MNRLQELSEAICKECGIKQKLTFKDFFFGKEKHYPNLGDPVNLLKIQNLIFKIGINGKYDFQLASMAGQQDDKQILGGETFEEIYLLCLWFYVNPFNPDKWDRKFSKMLKQEFKKVKWKYD